MRIRDMEQNDMPALALLYEQFWSETQDAAAMAARFQDLSALGTHIFLCAEEDGLMRGSVMASSAGSCTATADRFSSWKT